MTLSKQQFIDDVIAADARKEPADQAQMHVVCLHEVLDDNTSSNVYDRSLQRCHAYLDRGIGVDCRGPSKPAMLQFMGYGWMPERSGDIAGLLERYVMAGLSDTQAPIRDMSGSGKFVDAPTPLEFAVRQGAVSKVQTLLKVGADAGCVPAEDYQLKPGELLARAGNTLAFVDALDLPYGDEMSAVVREHLMAKHIGTAAVDSTSATSLSASAARRQARVL